jgi:PleD family two-component response regulator
MEEEARCEDRSESGAGRTRSRADSVAALAKQRPLFLLAVTASMGIAQFDSARHRDPDDLYRAADKSVYRAKAEGRNRVCTDNTGPVLQESPATR